MVTALDCTSSMAIPHSWEPTAPEAPDDSSNSLLYFLQGRLILNRYIWTADFQAKLVCRCARQAYFTDVRGDGKTHL